VYGSAAHLARAARSQDRSMTHAVGATQIVGWPRICSTRMSAAPSIPRSIVAICSADRFMAATWSAYNAGPGQFRA